MKTGQTFPQRCPGLPAGAGVKGTLFLISELNGIFNLGLGSELGFDRMGDCESAPEKPIVLMTGWSHIIREGNILADRG